MNEFDALDASSRGPGALSDVSLDDEVATEAAFQLASSLPCVRLHFDERLLANNLRR
jgi:hypothetical protein